MVKLAGFFEVEAFLFGSGRGGSGQFVFVIDIFAACAPGVAFPEECDDSPDEEERGEDDGCGHSAGLVAEVHEFANDVVSFVEAEENHEGDHDDFWEVEAADNVAVADEGDTYLCEGDDEE